VFFVLIAEVKLAGPTMYQRARVALAGHHGDVLTLAQLRILIKKELASSNAIIANYLKVMEETGLTKEIEPFKYQIKID